MDISMKGVGMELGTALQTHTEGKIADIQHYFDQVHAVEAYFKEVPHGKHEADLTVHASGATLRAEGEGADSYAALDAAFAKAVAQLKRYKGRLQSHREQRQKYEAKLAGLAPVSFEDAAVEEASFEGMPGDMFAEFAPEIVRKDVSEVAPMSVDEAVMHMDLLHKPAYLFQNAKTGKLNMVYKEKGNVIRWVAPK
ncbi:MAG: ribosomal subunit interface protein [Alphaproteobacteria bacterium CG_4_10_14_0_8_um_filter_53_9]|nr:MAG: ribosomal subunit interface protein [Alphaproteobacteria bacterium CG_4_10_14_0_8_um_filter_53_9]